MANIFSIFKQVRPRKTILSDDFNGLQSALKTSFDSLGTAAPPGQFGVSSAFYVGTPTDPNHATTVTYITAEIATLGAPVVADATAQADRAEAEADAAAASAALAEAIRYTEVQASFDAQDAVLAGYQTTIDTHHTDVQAILDDYEVLIYAGL